MNSPSLRRVAIVGYNTIAEGRRKGVMADSEAGYNLWFNPGGRLERSVVYIPFGRDQQATWLTDRILYVEDAFPRSSSQALNIVRFALRLPAAVLRLRRLVREHEAQVMRANGPNIGGLLVWLYSRLWSIPTVLFQEAFWEEMLPRQTNLPGWMRRLLPYWYRLLYRSFDVYSGTPSLNPGFYTALGMPADRIGPWNYEMDTDLLERQVEAASLPAAVQALAAPRICTVGRLHPEKRSSDGVRMVKELENFGFRASLVFVGDGEQRAELEALATELGVRDRICISGYVSQAEALLIARRSEAYFAPMQGTALIEAMLSGAPIVSYDNAFHRFYLQEEREALFVPNGDWAAAAGAFARVFSDPDLARRIGAAAVARARDQFSPERNASVILAPLEMAFARRQR
jgi:glycosyltransferase involved in cell wall biosynthesis